MINRIKYILPSMLGVLAIVLIGAVITTSDAGAISNIAPDEGDFSTSASNTSSTGSRNMMFVTDTTGAQSWFSVVAIYSRTSIVSVTIKDAHLCSDGGRFGDGPQPNIRTNFVLESYDPTDGVDFGSSVDVVGCNGGVSDITITRDTFGPNQSAIVIDGITWYRAKLRVTMDNSQPAGNSFEVTANGAGSIVSYYSESGNQFTLQDRGLHACGSGDYSDCPPRLTDYNLKFGTECTIQSETEATIRWFDDDRYSLQSNPAFGYRMLLVEKNRSGATTSTYFLNFDGSTNFIETSGWTGDQTDGYAKFTAKPDHIYEWVWTGVQRNNAVQFQVPYDSIYYEYGCGNSERYAMEANVIRASGGSNVIEPGGAAQFKAAVFNQGDVTARGSTTGVYPNATPGPALGISCSFTTAGSTNPGSLSINGSPSCFSAPPWNSAAYNNAVTIDVDASANIGDRVCLDITGTALNGFSSGTDPQGSFTDRACFTVGVSPYLQVNYGDVWAGADFDTALNFPVPAACGTVHNDSQIKSVTYQDSISSLWRGSFVEYGAYATGSISNFGSSNAPNGTLLTFATDPNLGNYTNTPKCIPNYYGLLNAHTYPAGTDITSNSRNLSAFSDDKEQFKVTPSNAEGTFTLTGNNQNYSKTQTIVIDGNLVIPNNIEFDTSYSNTTNLDVPSLVFVVNGDIFIDQSVKEVDAILISHGNVWTCTSGSTLIRELADGVCDEPLTINGAIVANRVNFMRTHEGNGRIGGVHDVNSQPAEVINFLPEFYLSDPIFKSDYIDGNSFETVLIKDLPPIY